MERFLSKFIIKIRASLLLCELLYIHFLHVFLKKGNRIGASKLLKTEQTNVNLSYLRNYMHEYNNVRKQTRRMIFFMCNNYYIVGKDLKLNKQFKWIAIAIFKESICYDKCLIVIFVYRPPNTSIIKDLKKYWKQLKASKRLHVISSNSISLQFYLQWYQF